MQQREKKILWGIGGAVGLYVAYTLFHGWFIQPLNDLDARIETATTAVESAQRGERQLRAAEVALAQARQMSLPKSPSEARRLYLRWIEELTAECGIQTTKNPEALNERLEQQTYTAFPVKVEGIATYEQSLLFLRRFSEVGLLQRLSQFDLLIYGPGDPRLYIRFTAEGVSMNGAADRSSLFNETLLVDPLAPSQTTLAVSDVKGFPDKPPFLIKVGSEWMRVTALNKNLWTVERGANQSTAADHAKGASVALYPLKTPGPAEPSVEAAYQKLASVNPFRKPRPPIEYKPRINVGSNLLVTKGTPWSLNLKAEGWDPEAGAPTFVAEGELPAGLKLDEKTGALSWSPAKDFAPGEYKVRVAAIGSYNQNFKTQADISIRVRDANQPPRFSDIRPPVAYLGRPWTVEAAATDPDANDKLKYAFSGTPPMGATIDANGKITWTPPEDMETGQVSLTVTATDTGDPPLTVSKAVVVRVEEDAARYTRFVGTVSEDGVQEAWFFDPSINKKTRLKAGSLFKFADVEGTLEEIHSSGDYIILSTGGKRMKLVSGKTIREMVEADPPPPMAEARVSPGA